MNASTLYHILQKWSGTDKKVRYFDLEREWYFDFKGFPEEI